MAEEAAGKKVPPKKPTAKRIRDEAECLARRRKVEPDDALEQLAKDQLMKVYNFKLQAWANRWKIIDMGPTEGIPSSDWQWPTTDA